MLLFLKLQNIKRACHIRNSLVINFWSQILSKERENSSLTTEYDLLEDIYRASLYEECTQSFLGWDDGNYISIEILNKIYNSSALLYTRLKKILPSDF